MIEYLSVRLTRKKALVLAGGGTRGSYQNGALKALKKIHETDFDIVTREFNI